MFQDSNSETSWLKTELITESHLLGMSEWMDLIAKNVFPVL